MNAPPATDREVMQGVPLDATGRIDTDTACVHCEYNLRTLPEHGVCPECGNPVADSHRWGDQRVREWLARVTGACSTLSVMVVVGCVLGPLFCVIGFAWGPFDLLGYVSCGVFLLVIGSAIRMVSLTARPPDQAVARKSRVARLAVRLGALLVAAAVACSAVSGAAYSSTLGRTTAILCGVLLVVSTCGVLPLSGFAYLSILTAHVGRVDLARRCRRMAWTIAASDLWLLGTMCLSLATRSTTSQTWRALVKAAPCVLIIPCVMAVVTLCRVSGALREARDRCEKLAAAGREASETAPEATAGHLP